MKNWSLTAIGRTLYPQPCTMKILPVFSLQVLTSICFKRFLNTLLLKISFTQEGTNYLCQKTRLQRLNLNPVLLPLSDGQTLVNQP